MSRTQKQPSYLGRPIQKKTIGDRVVRFRTAFSNTIFDVLKGRGWQEVQGDMGWDFYWCDLSWMREVFDHYYMEEHCRINHFRNHYELTRKNLMVKNLKKFRKQVEREQGKLEASKCDFFPTTFELPSEYHMFVEEFKRNLGSLWIMKPIAKAQGKGIFLFRKLKDITDWKKESYKSQEERRNDDKEPVETYIVQKYIENPYLIGGKKFDLRVYVLVTSIIPMKAWLYREGFARFSNTRYSLDSIDDTYIHLTNVAVQKTAPEYDADKGCKWSLNQLRRYLIARHGIEAVEDMLKKMDDIFIYSLLCVQKIMINDKHCFELYGYDIMLDEKLKPWLIETNASPSLTASNQEDYELKCRLLEDTLNVVDMEGRLTGKEKRIGGYDLMWNDGPVTLEEGGLDCMSAPTYTSNTHLGCFNDREKQLKQLFRSLQMAKKTTTV
ncbi:probable tubulin polyglutamylase TTLL9 isoform X1 [Branchiostoma lanceolatum]|uniref:probable tubulin polyglutamylase TTLL9 isoform X1 n=2 Tax=Branchiostoma lanceolatum TaxID=7740 RepID=UPI003456B150